MILVIQKLLNITWIVFIFYLPVAGLSGCAKEYSYEGGPTIDTLIHIDTIPVADTHSASVFGFPYCEGCRNKDDFIAFTWNFKTDTSLLCGGVTNAVITPERTGFTFFGPSTCSADTGLVMTVFLNGGALNRDQTNITTNLVTFQYYDNTTFTDIFNSGLRTISFTIDSYIHSTGIAKGRFRGSVRAKNNNVVEIKDGKFVIQF